MKVLAKSVVLNKIRDIPKSPSLTRLFFRKIFLCGRERQYHKRFENEGDILDLVLRSRCRILLSWMYFIAVVS